MSNTRQKHYSSNWLLWLILILGYTFTSCKSDESVGVPEITAVRVADPAKADSTFTKAWPGAQIVILGRNLGGAHHVYIDDQSVYFNPTMNTDHSIILTIPTEEKGFKLASWNKDLKPEIRVETPGGVATFSFKVLNPVPSGQRIAGLYPRSTGDKLKFYGRNLVDIVRVYFTDRTMDEIAAMDTLIDIGGKQVEVKDYSLTQNKYLDAKTKLYTSESVMDFSLPELPYGAGTLVVECEAGFAYAEFAKLPPKPILRDISSDMPISGTKVVLTGANFIQVAAVKYGQVVIPAEQLHVSASEDSITFVMGAKPDAPVSEILVETPGGQAKMPFYRKSSVLVNFDDLGFDNAWSPNAVYQTANPDAAPFVSDGKYAWMDVQDNGWNWWGTMVYWKANEAGTAFKLPDYSVIPANTPSNRVFLAMEVYNTRPFDGTAMIHYLLETDKGNMEYVNWDWNTSERMEDVLMDSNGNCPLNQWYRAVLPFSKFDAFKGKTYKDIVESGWKQLRLMDHNYAGTPMKLNVCFDNIRVIMK